jgi:RTX calcium-binding nonapeptide repeat (4 copies)/PASTA domain
VTLLAANWSRGFASGGAGDDRLFGTQAGDVLHGDGGSDKVEGWEGPDELTGGGGVDTLLGGDGGDSIEARDGIRDDIECGAGSDQVRADAVDAVAADCEDVERGGVPPPGAPPSAVTVIAANVGRTSATMVAVVNPRGSATTVAFEFGPTERYGSRTETRTIGSTAGDTVVEMIAPGLVPGMTYHFRAVATSAEGTTLGRDLSFTTLAAPSAPARVCVVPRLLGRSLKAARAALTRSRCRVGAVRHVRARAKRGTVVAQGSRAGRRLPVGARVNLTVSR